MALSCLSLTTTPWRVRFGIVGPLLRLGRALLRSNGFDTSDVAARFTQPRGVLKLAGGPLEAQVETLLLQIRDRIRHLVVAHRADIFDLELGHDPTPRSAPRSAS